MSFDHIQVQVDRRFQGQVRPASLHRAALATLVHQHVDESYALVIAVTGDDALRELNRRHRQVDAPTDVLAFSGEALGPFVAAPDQPRHLGDVVISLDRAEAQAADADHDAQVELQLLVVHGVLHLLGYDDST
ncbi:MAG: rRNA maturation RNase YbeY, partial [Anaerolineae bacterium]|nr:rRNA maturation RNase YbeY [Anaerolineae bacterium]